MGFCDLAIVVLQDEGAVPVQHARAALLQRCRVFARLQPFACRFHANEARFLERDVGVEDAHGVAAATHAGDHGIGLVAQHLLLCQHGGHLVDALLADHALEVTHHHGVGVWACHRADDVEGVVHIGHPVAHGLVEGIFQRLAA
ncbi:hypothetical protein D3C71_1619970 [compost metagenome]